MQTVLSSPSRTVTIGPDHPFVVIGERINPTGRKALAQQMLARNMDMVRADALRQVEAGSHMLDVNAGVPGDNVEPEILREAIRAVQEVVDVPLSIDSSMVARWKPV
jgi:5-methyltetrahydrofolate--homocysteine methyltransferase